MNESCHGLSGLLRELSSQDFVDRHWRQRMWFRSPDDGLAADCAELIGGTDLAVLVARAVSINAYREFKDIARVESAELALHLYRELGATLYMYLEKGDSARAYLERTLASPAPGSSSEAARDRRDAAAADRDSGTALTRVRRELARVLGCGMPYASLFAARPPSGGTPLHCDNNENLTVQLRGTKRWRIASTPVVPHCVVAGEWNPAQPFGGRSLCEFAFEEVVMTPGAVLYVPRGHLHEVAVVGAEESLLLNISMPVISWTDEIVAALSQTALAVESLRRCPNALDGDLAAQAATALDQVRAVLGGLGAAQLVARARRRLAG